ncbi:MAG TPA: hypothetical protein VF712_01315 [Thermoleophilaceae bacterium]|jgi:hypothetical protein
MNLKTLIATAVTCVAVLGATAPASAKQDSGNGKAQRCVAAQNGNHNGFSCEDIVDDADGTCSRNFTRVLASIVQNVDVNENGYVCARD